MKKELREKVFSKYNGRCAYSGTILDDDWQVDHLVSKMYFNIKNKQGVNDFENLMPVQKIINHYKRSLTLEDFRNWYLGELHLRLKKLPKNPKSKESIRRKEYLLKIAELFDINENKPFDGIFYFETL